MTTTLAVRENAAVAAWTPTFAVTVDEAVANIEQKREFFRRAMRKTEHYGPIPGTKPKDGEPERFVLFKSGAEMLLANMGLRPELSDADTPTVDYGDKDREGLIRYRRTCRIYRQIGPTPDERMLVAEAAGACSSRETKYRWRDAKPICPLCNMMTVNRSKQESDGFYCWKKIGGCGATFKPNDERITSQPVGRMANPDLADLENTVLKMADKRAMVAATLLATGCSDIFTQDVGDTENDPPRDERPDDIEGEFVEQPTHQAMIDEIYGLLCSLKLDPKRAVDAVEWASNGRTTDYSNLTAEEAPGLLRKLRAFSQGRGVAVKPKAEETPGEIPF